MARYCRIILVPASLFLKAYRYALFAHRCARKCVTSLIFSGGSSLVIDISELLTEIDLMYVDGTHNTDDVPTTELTLD